MNVPLVKHVPQAPAQDQVELADSSRRGPRRPLARPLRVSSLVGDVSGVSLRTVVVGVLGVVGMVVAAAMLDVREVVDVLGRASLGWVLAAFALSTLTWVGGAVTLAAFTPGRLPVRVALVSQVAASFVTVFAPAGTGPAVVNLRVLNRRRLGTRLAVAVVALQQVLQLVVMLVVLLVLAAVSGSFVVDEAGVAVLRGAVAVGVAGVCVVALFASVGWVRRRVAARVVSVWVRVRPQVRWLWANPARLVVAVVGNLLMNVGFVGAFLGSMYAVGVDVGSVSAAVVYLTANSLGSVVPSPGGIGALEGALTGGLQVVGVPLGAALAVVTLYRVVTFYVRVPVGWVALHVLSRRGEL